MVYQGMACWRQNIYIYAVAAYDPDGHPRDESDDSRVQGPASW
jgi:hypothetical protein